MALLGSDAVPVVRDHQHQRVIAQGRRVENAPIAALAAATDEVPTMLSYSYEPLTADLATAQAVVTGSFHTEFLQLLGQVVGPTAASNQIVTKATVAASSARLASEDTVVVLVFIDQTTTSAEDKTPRIDGRRAAVTMTKVNGTWLISKLTPV